MGRAVILRVGIRALVGASVGGPTLVVGVVAAVFRGLPSVAEFLSVVAAMAPVALACGCVGAACLFVITSRKKERWTSAKWGWTGALLGLVIAPTATTLLQALTTGDWLLAVEGSWRLSGAAMVAGGVVGGIVGRMSSDDLEGTPRSEQAA